MIELCDIKAAQGGTLKPWPEFVEGLFGGVVNEGLGLYEPNLFLTGLTAVCLGVKLLPNFNFCFLTVLLL